MDSYKKILDSVFNDDTYNWWYYENLNRTDFDKFKLKESSRELIEKIYHAGGKDSFFSELDSDLNEQRCAHMVSAFFIGHYFVRHLSVFYKLKKDCNFSWLWFLCCLYHDAYFVNEKTDKHKYSIPYYYSDSEMLLHSKDTIEKYRTMRLTDGRNDHGIYAAAAISNHYNCLYEKNQYIPNKLFINNDTKISVNCIAKVIASHNIFIASYKTKEKYRKNGLDILIPSDNNECKMPTNKSKYELLYLLLCLVDIIEPTKRNMDIDNIYLSINDMKDIELSFLQTNNTDRCNDYLKNIADSEVWLNYINVDFSKKNNQYTIKINIM